MEENVIEIKSFDFAVRTVDLYKYLTETKHEYVMAKQLLRCGTSIGANVAEAEKGFSFLGVGFNQFDITAIFLVCYAVMFLFLLFGNKKRFF